MEALSSPHRAGRLVRTVLALLVAFAGLPAVGAAVVGAVEGPTIVGEPCTSEDDVTVVVDLTFLEDETGTPIDEVRIGCAEGPQADGFAALAAAGFDVVDNGGFLCTIDGLPRPEQTDCMWSGYWSYWHAEAGWEADWEYSNWGAGGRTPPPGSVEGWSFWNLADPPPDPENGLWANPPRITPSDLGLIAAPEPQSQTITFATLADRTVGDAPFLLTATATSGLAVTFTASGPCQVEGAAVTVTAAGTCSITATQPGDSQWAPAEPVTRTFEVSEPPAGEEIDDRTAGARASAWLASQLPDAGAYQNPLGGVLPDYGLTIDALLAMYASGDGHLAEPIVTLLDDEGHASSFFTWGGLVPDDPDFTQIITAGATAKTLVAALAAGRDPRSFGGYDLVAETLGTIVTGDIEPSGRVAGFAGRIRDYSKLEEYESSVWNSANMFGQSLAVIGLAGAGESFEPGEPARLAVSALVAQQCAEGYFRIFFSETSHSDPDHPTVTSRTQTCDEGKATNRSFPDGDATGHGLSALLAAREAGAEGLDDAIDRAVDWLEANQDTSGGWGGGVGTDAPNANSSGLIVQALADAGADPEVIARGRAYLRRLQIGTDVALGGLADHLGAVAYNAASFESAVADGSITWIDTWIRTTAQAALGFNDIGFYDLVTSTGTSPQPEPGSEPTITLSRTAVRPGDEVTVSATGLAPAEEVTVTLHSSPILLATVATDATGALSHTFTVPAVEPGSHRLELVGLSSSTVLSIDVDVLAAAPPAPSGPTSEPPSPPAPLAEGSGFGGGALPRTGSDLVDLVAVGVALAGLGALVAGGSRRRGRNRPAHLRSASGEGTADLLTR